MIGPCRWTPNRHPGHGDYRTDLTKAWSEKIRSGDAFVFVSPQYNWGYPAVLKNALDHLYREWTGKPAMIVTYGGHGGNKCAAQLHQVLTGLKMKPTETMPGFSLSRSRIEANVGEVDPATEFAGGDRCLNRLLASWAASGHAILASSIFPIDDA